MSVTAGWRKNEITQQSRNTKNAMASSETVKGKFLFIVVWFT